MNEFKWIRGKSHDDVLRSLSDKTLMEKLDKAIINNQDWLIDYCLENGVLSSCKNTTQKFKLGLRCNRPWVIDECVKEGFELTVYYLDECNINVTTYNVNGGYNTCHLFEVIYREKTNNHFVLESLFMNSYKHEILYHLLKFKGDVNIDTKIVCV